MTIIEYIRQHPLLAGLHPARIPDAHSEVAFLKNEITRLETIILTVNTGVVTDIVDEADAILEKRFAEKRSKN